MTPKNDTINGLVYEYVRNNPNSTVVDVCKAFGSHEAHDRSLNSALSYTYNHHKILKRHKAKRDTSTGEKREMWVYSALYDASYEIAIKQSKLIGRVNRRASTEEKAVEAPKPVAAPNPFITPEIAPKPAPAPVVSISQELAAMSAAQPDWNQVLASVDQMPMIVALRLRNKLNGMLV